MDLLKCLPCFSKPSFKLFPDFQPLRRLGKGMEGEVWLCRDLESEQLVAIKLIPRGAPAWQLAMVEHEISIMLELGVQHPNIVNPRELVLSPSHLGLVQEYMSGGTLADYLKAHKADEALACYFFRQIIAAVEYCHKHRVAWRDIKLENTLLDRSSPPRVVACDFGNSKQWAKKSKPVMYSITGTPGYISPEIMEAAFNETTPAYDATKSDVWSCGVLLCLMLMHHFPYDFDDMVKAMPPANALRMLLKLEKTRSWSQATGDADKLSAEARDLLDQIFQPEFQRRITIAGIKQHPWFTQQLPAKYADALKRQEKHIMKAMSLLQSQRASSISSMRRTQSLSQLKEDPEEEQQQLKRIASNAQQPPAAGKDTDEQKVKAALQVQLQQQLQLSQHLQAQRQHMLSRDSPIQHLRVQDSASDISSTPTTPKHKGRDNKAVMAQVSELLDAARRIGLPGMWSGLKRVALTPAQ